MARPRLSQDRQVLREKLEIVGRLLKVYADGAVRVEAEIATITILQPNIMDADFVKAIKRAMVPMSKQGVDISYIEQDLKTEQSKLGAGFASKLTGLQSKIVQFQKDLLSSIRGGPPVNIPKFVDVLLDTLSAVTEPAKALRDRLTQELNHQPKGKIETTGQYMRGRRDEHIRLLSKVHHTRSAAELLRLAKEDQELRSMLNSGVRVTTDVIRNAMKKRKLKR